MIDTHYDLSMLYIIYYWVVFALITIYKVFLANSYVATFLSYNDILDLSCYSDPKLPVSWIILIVNVSRLRSKMATVLDLIDNNEPETSTEKVCALAGDSTCIIP